MFHVKHFCAKCNIPEEFDWLGTPFGSLRAMVVKRVFEDGREKGQNGNNPAKVKY